MLWSGDQYLYQLINASYGTCAFLYATFSLVLLYKWRTWRISGIFIAATMATSIWALAIFFLAEYSNAIFVVLFPGLEIIRTIFWVLFLLGLLSPLIVRDVKLGEVWFGRLRAMLIIFGICLYLFEFFSNGTPYFSKSLWPDVHIFAHLMLALAGLGIIEQLFRNTKTEHRWGIKFLYFGVGVLFSYDFFVYADALLFRRLDLQMWASRGFVDSLALPLLFMSVKRNSEWSIGLFVSQRMALHTASVLGAGLYLIIMAGVGYYIRSFGGTWGTAIQSVFIVSALILLIILMFSGQLRAYARVFLSKHFYHYKYDYRDEWLKFTETLSAEGVGEPVRERAIRAIAELVDSSGGWLWQRDESGMFVLSATRNARDSEQRSIATDSSLCQFLSARQWVIEIGEYLAEPDLYEGLDLPSWLTGLQRVWLIVPLMQIEQLQGFVILTKPSISRAINWEDRDLLKTAGRQVAGFVALLDATEALMNTKQFDAFNRLSAFIVHDLKNVAAQLSLVVKNAEKHRNNPAFVDDAFKTVENATGRMNRLLSQLSNKTNVSENIRIFSLHGAIQEVVEISRSRAPLPVVVGDCEGIELRANRDKFVAIICHLVRNAQEATPITGSVKICLGRENRWISIKIVDTGCGMDVDFIRASLFKPFQTTKGNAGMGVGVYESRAFVLGIGGDIKVDSAVGIGTTFALRLPIVDTAAIAGGSVMDQASASSLGGAGNCAN
ncbi:XrtA/PEP-CTERM system histidine kinase PrsK [Plasticicumulans acidivorans]|uniref:histidine kinase n=1 Tax=Plasticicumulans acidivorans TaxID=886464 RepID=A0A317MSW6_9GAMM|nr:XrtA/PEP-CTERM system histidine kinase PrsK [Plasticicumulans acidivorans]PWV60483.1 putative PEP-CTERM system histidine kinase [Plasticicumulans acidivorans]